MAEAPAAGVQRSTGFKRRFLVLRSNVAIAARSKGTWQRALITVLVSTPLVLATWKAGGPKLGVLALGTQVVLLAYKSWSQTAPKNLEAVERSSTERRLLLYRTVQKMSRWPSLTPAEVHDYQRDVLSLVVSFVRDHRSDRRGSMVFANLLVRRGESLVVIARDKDHRAPDSSLPLRGTAAGDAFRSGSSVSTGDVENDYPLGPRRKPYCSVLAIPVRYADRVVGIVTIDSARKFHFDFGVDDEVVDHVMPYLALLSWTLRNEPA